MQLLCMFQLVLKNVCPDFQSPREEPRPRSNAVDRQRRLLGTVCILPALHQRGSSLAAVGLGCFQDCSRADGTLLPTICGVSRPSPYSVATGESGCQWFPASAGPCESLPATDYWGVSTSGWTHPWWGNNYIVKNLLSWMLSQYQLVYIFQTVSPEKQSMTGDFK